MGVISVRLPDDLHRELELAKMPISQHVREDLMRVALALRAQRKMASLAKYRKPARRPVADVVREAREDH